MNHGMHSLRNKLLLIAAITCTFSLTLAGVAITLNAVREYRHTLQTELQTQADIIGLASVAALQFDDATVAQENLALLKLKPEVISAALYTRRGLLFASFGAPSPARFDASGRRAVVFGDQEVTVLRPVQSRGEGLGTVVIRAHYEWRQRVFDFLGILLLATAASLILSLLLSIWLHRSVNRSIASISTVARQVIDQRDFNLRATKISNDEIGYLADAFNDMLLEIGRRTAELEASNVTLLQEMAERREIQAALHESEQHFRALVAAMTSVVWTADAQHRFQDGQISWARYTGQSPAIYRQRGWLAAIHPDDHSRVDGAWARNGFEVEVRVWNAQAGRHRYCSMRGVPITDVDGAVRSWIGSLSDIDDRRSAETEVRRLNAELEQRVAERTASLQEANDDLESFSYSVSHDLRAPVRAISGFATMLWEQQAAQLDSSAQRFLSIIRGEAQRMGGLIDDLLAFSRLGRQALQPVLLNMQDLAQSTYDSVLAIHNGPAVTLMMGELPAVQGDRGLLRQVWANLMANALKFSSTRSSPRVEIGASIVAGEAIFFVRDNGVGFDPRHQPKLFGVFQRLHDASEFPGTGVGLALVQRIVTRHGGRVWAESRLNEGACFYFSLPYTPPAAVD